MILIVVSATAFLPNYGGSVGAVALIPQSVQWNRSQGDVLHSLIGSLFLIGAGGIVVVAHMAYFGCLPILF